MTKKHAALAYTAGIVLGLLVLAAAVSLVNRAVQRPGVRHTGSGADRARWTGIP